MISTESPSALAATGSQTKASSKVDKAMPFGSPIISNTPNT